MARTDPQINIRIPAGLKQRIEAAAAAGKRSMIAEIVDRLERSFDFPEAVEHVDLRGVSGELLSEAVEQAMRRIINDTPSLKLKDE